MILVDTNIWIDHIRHGDAGLVSLLANEQVAVHPYILAELALGSLTPASPILADLGQMPMLVPADHHEVMALIAVHGLAGSGIGYVDCHLLCAAVLAGAQVWTRDRRLAAQAHRLAIRFEPAGQTPAP